MKKSCAILGLALLLGSACGGESSDTATPGSAGSAGVSGGSAGSAGAAGSSAGSAGSAGVSGGSAGSAGVGGASFACGSTTCGATQYCVSPCCGGAPPLCVPKTGDAGACPVGTTPGCTFPFGSCSDPANCCQAAPCDPPPPYCVDSAPSGCLLQGRSCLMLCA